jgi:hypothetical protein
MTTAEETAAALKASKAINQGQQTLTEESRLLLAAMLRDEMRVAVSEGLEAVLTNEAVWAKVFLVLQKQATERTGRFVLGGVTVVLKKVVWVGAFALIAYSIGGWTLLKTIWAAVKGAP